MSTKDVVVSDLMTRYVVTCSPEEPLLEVIRQITLKRFSCLVVVQGHSPVGIITERDLVELLSEVLEGTTWDELSIKNFMSAPIITINENLTLAEAILTTQKNKIRHMPIVDKEGDLVGILTQSDIVKGYYKTLLAEGSSE
ncbi:CBS domain-containing protein [Beggiatoa alba]|nr:CBS domain-containing protein [Beggiatoa alba]